MSSQKISQMPPATMPLDGTELVPIVQNGINKKATTTEIGQNATPLGTVIMFAGSSAPIDYLICDGSAVSRTTYAGLFAVIGTTYGAGDTTTTFNIPDLRGLFVRGVGPSNVLGSTQSSNIGSHTHDFKDVWTIEPDSANPLNIPALNGGVQPPAVDVNGAPLDYALYKYDFSNVEENRIRPTSDTGGEGVNDNVAWTLDNRTAAAGSGDTHPANIALNYIIRAM